MSRRNIRTVPPAALASRGIVPQIDDAVCARSHAYRLIGMLMDDLRQDPYAATFFIPGEPKGKARAFATVMRRKDGSFVTGANGRAVIHHFTPKDTTNYEANVGVWYRETRPGPPTHRPVVILLDIYHAPAGSWPAWKFGMVQAHLLLPVTKPDADNVEKAVKDALNGIAWIDDTQVVACIKRKAFADEEGVRVTVIPLGEWPSNVRSREGIRHLKQQREEKNNASPF